MTDAEIDETLEKIRRKREVNNFLFIEWLKVSFKCPHCRHAAAQYQELIREGDTEITLYSEPLTRL